MFYKLTGSVKVRRDKDWKRLQTGELETTKRKVGSWIGSRPNLNMFHESVAILAATADSWVR